MIRASLEEEAHDSEVEDLRVAKRLVLEHEDVERLVGPVPVPFSSAPGFEMLELSRLYKTE